MRTKEEKNAACKMWHDANKDRRKAYRLANRERRSELNRAWYLKNRDSHLESSSQWNRDNPGKRRAIASQYRAAKLQRTPVWADHLVISMIYEDCPEGMQVDHIYPLQGDTVSGLHTAWNLQYLTPLENQSKGNRI